MKSEINVQWTKLPRYDKTLQLVRYKFCDVNVPTYERSMTWNARITSLVTMHTSYANDAYVIGNCHCLLCLWLCYGTGSADTSNSMWHNMNMIMIECLWLNFIPLWEWMWRQNTSHLYKRTSISTAPQAFCSRALIFLRHDNSVHVSVLPDVKYAMISRPFSKTKWDQVYWP